MPGCVLVTGGSGFAGSHLLDLLTSAGESVVAWYRPAGKPPRDLQGVTWIAVDLMDRAAVRHAISDAQPSAIYHCAGAAHVGRSWETSEPTFAVNVKGTHYLVEALREFGIPARVLIPGSALIYANTTDTLTEDHPIRPTSPYALSKLAQEMLGNDDGNGPSIFIARAFNHFGPRQDPWFAASGFARRISDIEAGRWQPEISVGNLDTFRDLTDVRDTVRAYRDILERGVPGRPYNICSGRTIAIKDLLDMMLARARVPIRIKVDPTRYRPNDQPVILGSSRRIHDELGWSPAIPLEKTVDDLLRFWRDAAATS